MPDLEISDRLAALRRYDILDTPAEQEFDDIVLLAAQICHAPVALVSFVDQDRQWFKARIGLDASETPLDQSVCVHALAAGDDILVIPDLSEDPRTKNNPLVRTGPQIRFYAGAVLRAPDGQSLGTLCVVDLEPRPLGLTDAQLAGLRALARQVMTQMELRKSLVKQQADAEFMKGVLAASDDCIKILDLDANLTFMSEGGQRIMEVSDYNAIHGCPWPDFWQGAGNAAAKSAVASARAGGSSRFQGHADTAAGTPRFWDVQVSPILGPDGLPSRLLSVSRDITQLKAAEIRQTRLVGLGDALREATAHEEAGRAAAQTLVEVLGAARAGYTLIDALAGTYVRAGEWAAPGVPAPDASLRLDAFPATMERLRRGDPVVEQNVLDAPWLVRDAPSYERLGTRALIAIPLTSAGRLVGVLSAHSATPRSWSVEEVEFAYAVADRAFAALGKLNAEEEQKLLNMELNHRLKNTLAMVQAIAAQTLRGVTETTAVEAFGSRLMALAKAHDVLLQRSWSAAPIAVVIEGVLGLHGDKSRYDLGGPMLRLGPKATLSLSLLLHELATNAIKYGALSNQSGQIAVHWSIEGNGPAAGLSVEWRESGGPPVTEPERRGFGSRLIKMGILGTGSAAVRYDTTGLQATFKAPLSLIGES